MPSRRLALAFAVSLLLHAALPVGDLLSRGDGQRAAPPPLLARLLPAADEALLKNTLTDDRPDPPPAPPVSSPPPVSRAPREPAAKAPEESRPQSLRAVEQKLAEQVFYPPEAIARGLEGRVLILFVFAGDGRVVEVQLAAGSGHALLDRAALRAAGAIGRVPGAVAGEMILPVIFQLE